MSNIRVTYSGLISLVIGISSIITGTIFTLIVTRSITPEEFGTWSLIGGLITYVVIVEPIISYWVTRETARGVDAGKTAIFTSGIFSIAGILGYIIIGYFVALQSDANQDVILFAVILVPLLFLNKTLTAINLGWKPQSTSYGILAFEITKVPCALALVYFLDMGIFGAILTTADSGASLNNLTGTLSEITPGTSGNLLTSDGTNWASAAAPAALKYRSETDPSCQAVAESRSIHSIASLVLP